MAKPFFSAYRTILAFFTANMTKSSSSFRVVSYNVLSSQLASPSHFTSLDPQHLEASARLPKILDKLEEQITSSGDDEDGPTIFCLQEVSYQWAGPLHTFFANRGFHVVTGLYGQSFNGYMGVLTAWPTSKLETVDVDICRLSDTVKWPKVSNEGSILGTIYETAIAKPLQWMGLTKPPPESHWSIAKRRYNVLLTAIVRDKKTGRDFCIANYHMPCCYYVPMVMTMHADMCIGHVQALAKDRPYVIAGDFNLKPSESVFRYLTSCQMPETDPFYPTPFQDDPSQPWKPTMKEPVRSAYSVCNNGKEPDFTNYARIGQDDPFIDTLDYIFVSNKVEPISTRILPSRENAGGPFPNEQEPSDHIMIASTMKLAG